MIAFDDVTFDFRGKSLLITGASSGIFQVVAEAYGKAGAEVAICDINKEGAEVTKTAIKSHGGSAEFYHCDVSQVSTIINCVKTVLSDFGKIDVLINGAGIVYREKAEIYPDEKWDLVINTHARGTFLMCREVGRHMIERGKGGKIVNTSSMLAWSGGFLVSSYASAKGAITQLTKSLCNEWAIHSINVNAIAPGYILTEITKPIQEDPGRNRSILDRLPIGRWGEPEDLIGPYLFLGSEAANYIHGTILTVDGGWLAR